MKSSVVSIIIPSLSSYQVHLNNNNNKGLFIPERNPLLLFYIFKNS